MRRSLLAAVCGLLVAAAPASATPPGGWCKRSTEVLARNASVVVYLGPRADSGPALCARYRRRRPLIVGDGRPQVLRLAGRFVFVAAIDPEEGRESADSYLYATLFDVARRTRRHEWRFFQFSGAPAGMTIRGAKVLRAGDVAFAVEGVDSEVAAGNVSEIHRATGRYRDVLARGAEVDARSLRYEGERMFWTDAGETFSAEFG